MVGIMGWLWLLLWLVLWDCYDCCYGWYHGIAMVAAIIAIMGKRSDNNNVNNRLSRIIYKREKLTN